MGYEFNIFGLLWALFVLALVVIPPIVVVAYITWKIKSKIGRTLFLLAFLASPFAFLFFAGYLGSSAMRIKQEHTLTVPSSASHIHCDPFFAISIFLDTGGEASFEMSRNDLPIFLAQLKLLRSESRPDDPSDMLVHHEVPDHFGRLISTFDGFSHDGNVMHIDVYDIDASTVGVWIGTISN